MAKLVSKTYGDALFELALEEKKEDLLFEEAKTFLEVIKKDDELVRLRFNSNKLHAIKIKYQNSEEKIENKKIISLDMATLVSGTKYRGEFEERIKKCLNEVKKAAFFEFF